MSITIYGASDDLIEVEGDIREEFAYADDDSSGKGDLIAVSDGTLLRVRYTSDGVWRIEPLRNGSAVLNIVQAVGPDSDNYSDRATLTADGIAWVAHGDDWASR